MQANEYQVESRRTANKERSSFLNLAIYGLGLGGEAGEVQDLIKKELGHGHEKNTEKIKDELGDVCWYIARILDEYKLTFEEVFESNIEKLKKRYPKGFSSEASINREE